uniref:Uncharacterized protein n=1 Tax=Knipowitschia caucasica TaxID=637954 RepID=A0AAV2KFL0_KNICA
MNRENPPPQTVRKRADILVDIAELYWRSTPALGAKYHRVCASPPGTLVYYTSDSLWERCWRLGPGCGPEVPTYRWGCFSLFDFLHCISI